MLFLLSVLLANGVEEVRSKEDPTTALPVNVDFSYIKHSENGPNSWHHYFPDCGGDRQSPIHINLARCSAGKFKPLQYLHGNSNPGVTIRNNGFTASFTFEYIKQRPILTGGPLTSKYVFEELHFHWGKHNSYGSEHKLNTQKRAAEMHLVHRNIKYGDKKLALQNEDGFAVIGILFQMSGSAPNLPYLRYLDLIRNLGTEVQLISYLQGFKISDFAGDLNEEFVTYRGSLTTPPCSEAVTWIIATQTRLISKFDILQLRAIKTIDDGKKSFNLRPPQELHDRSCHVL